MLERLIENWLDNASESSMQGPFCQLLAFKGHRILHSTRHAPTEQGKDVISMDGDGILCAYQLKGHPGRRMTINEWRKGFEQVNQLVHLAVQIPSAPESGHRSFLVTNGYVEEEVHSEVRMYNERNTRDGLSTMALG